MTIFRKMNFSVIKVLIRKLEMKQKHENIQIITKYFDALWNTKFILLKYSEGFAKYFYKEGIFFLYSVNKLV